MAGTTLRGGLKRLLVFALTLIGGALAVFFAMKLAPGDPALTALGENAKPELVAAFRHAHHLDVPLLAQFAVWIGGAIRGDFGRSLTLAGGVPVASLIATRLPVTVFIGIYALVLSIAVSLVLGTIAALQRGRLADTVATSFAVLGVSMPDFWLGYVLIFFSRSIFPFSRPTASFRLLPPCPVPCSAASCRRLPSPHRWPPYSPARCGPPCWRFCIGNT